MKSTAHIKGHPLHPILVSFPIAFFTGTVIADLIALIRHDNVWWTIGFYLEIAALISAAIAALPGLIDYMYTVPPQSSAKRRGLKHGLLNSLAVILFLTALFLRRDSISQIPLVLETAGLILMGIGSWLGGTLVVRNQIGVNPRYANAGKWKEQRLGHARGPIEVARLDELKVDQMKLIHLNGRRIVIGRTEDGYVAFDDYCSHRGGSLAGGAMVCGVVQCPWHGSQFNLMTGSVQAGPAIHAISIYHTQQENGKIYLNADEIDAR